MKFMLIIGTRAELIKVFPVIKEIEESEHELVFVSTGQHDLENLCEVFDIPKPDETLSEVPENSSKFNGSVSKAIKWNLGLIKDIRQLISRESPDHVLYHGDTMSTSLAAFSSSRLLFPFRRFETSHIEAGLRSGSITDPFPEEFSRIFADFVSNNLFAVSETSKNNLKYHSWMGKNVYNVGNTVVDSAKEAEGIGEPFDRENYGLVTVHRHENISSSERLEKIVEILEDAPRHLIFAMHDNTRNALEENGLMHRIEENEGIEVVDLVDYPDFVNMIEGAEIIYTDGGSIQEESLIYKVPCVVLRDRTERKEGMEQGLNFLSKLRVEETIEKAEEMAGKSFEDVKPVYGEPGVSRKILEKLEER